MMSVTISAYKQCLYEDSCLSYISCLCMHIVLLNTYCVVFLFCASSFCVSCTQNVASFYWLSIYEKKRHINVLSKRLTYFPPVLLVQYLFQYITNLVCYTYCHWFFSPECQHIFGKQTGYIFQSPKKIKTWTTKHYASLNQWYNTE